MSLQSILSLLENYHSQYPEESKTVSRIQQLINNNEDCLLRTCIPGHLTGSAWILSPDRSHVLMTHHRKLDKWLQLGGHADGEHRLHEVALREAREESGMQHFDVYQTEGQPVPLDLDVHIIPARKTEPQHEHHDFRFLLIAHPDQELEISEESNDLRWFTKEELLEVTNEESVLRMMRKTEQLLENDPEGFTRMYPSVKKHRS